MGTVAHLPRSIHHRYVNYSLVNRYNLAKQLYDSGHGAALTKPELDELQRMTEAVLCDLRKVYKGKPDSQPYAWSGLRSFKAIEDAVFEEASWNPRPAYIVASERIHPAPNAGESFQMGGGPPVFAVGPISGGLTGPAHLTSHSTVLATVALMSKASCTTEDEELLEEISNKLRKVAVMCWVVDPENICRDCGGHVLEALPPDETPIDERPEPCSCQQHGGNERG